MKKLLFLFSLILTVVSGYSQTQVSARRVSALEKLTIREKAIDSISIDTSMKSNSDLTISTTKAVKAYVDKRFGVGIFDTSTIYNVLSNKASITSLMDTAFAIRQSIATGGGTINFYATNLANLKTLNGVNGSYAVTLGYYTSGDGGYGQYRWDAASTETADDALVIQVTGVPTGRWKLMVSNNIVSLNQIGLKGDNSNELTVLANRLQLASLRNITVTGNGVFNLNGGSITVANGLRLRGDGKSFIIRNGAYLHIPGDIDVVGVVFNNFAATAVFYYPTPPAQDVTNIIEYNTFDTCKYAVFSQTAWPSGTEWRNSSFSHNTVRNIIRGVLTPKCDQIDGNFNYNKISGVYNNGVDFRGVFVLGGNGTINVENFTKNVHVTHNKISYIQYPQANGTVSNQCIAVDGASVNISFNEFYEVKVQNIYFSAEDAICEGNIHINDTTTGAEQAIIAKNGSYRGTAKVHKNIIRGYFSTGIYYDSQTKYAEITENTIDTKGSFAANGDAAIRYQNYGNVEEIKIRGNIITQDHSDRNVLGIQIGSGFYIKKTIIENNEIYTRSKGMQIYGSTSNAGLYVKVANNIIKSRLSTSIYGDDLDFVNNTIYYPVDTTTGNLVFGPRIKGVVSDNRFYRDTTITATSFVGQLFTIPAAASRAGAALYMNDNKFDALRASNLVVIENPLSEIEVNNEKIIGALPGNYFRVFSSAGGINLRMNNVVSLGSTGSILSTTITDTGRIRFTAINSTLLSTTFFVNSNNAIRESLILDNVILATSPALLKNWTTRQVKIAGTGNSVSSTANRTLGFRDLQEGKENYLLLNSAVGRTITIPDSSAVILPLNTRLKIIQQGAGPATVAAGSVNVTLLSPGTFSTARANHSIDIVQTAYNNWVVIPQFDTAGTAGGGGGGGGGADNWGSQVVITDTTMYGGGTVASPLGVDLDKVASKTFVESLDIHFSPNTVDGFKSEGNSVDPLRTAANMKTSETSSVDNQMVLFSGTGAHDFKKFSASNGFLKLQSNVPITQSTINLTTDVSGLLNIAMLNTTGTASSSTFLRGDGQWVAVSGGSGGVTDPGQDGIMIRSGLNTTIARSLAPLNSDVLVTNANGIAGNPTIGLAANMARLATAQTWTATQNFAVGTFSSLSVSSTSWDNSNFNVFSGGGSSTTLSNFMFAGNTGLNFKSSMRGSSTAAVGVGNSYSGQIWGIENVQEAGSGLHPWINRLTIKNLNITGAAATVGNTAIIYLENGNFATLVGGGRAYSLYAEGAIRAASLQGANLGAGVLVSNATGDITHSSTLPIANGGTNASTANGALNNLLPSQTGKVGQVLATNGTDAVWVDAEGYSVVAITTNNTTLTDAVTIAVPLAAAGQLEVRAIARNTIDADNQNVRSVVSYYGVNRNSTGLLGVYADVDDIHNVGTYTPTLNVAGSLLTSNQIKIRVASASTETTNWVIYYKIKYNTLID